MADNDVKRPEVVSQEGALVGDEAVAKAAKGVNVEKVRDTDNAQVAAKPSAPAPKVEVHETHYAADHVVTDPSSPEAVQVPDAGRGNADLPLHRLGDGQVEDKFAEADKEDKPKARKKDDTSAA